MLSQPIYSMKEEDVDCSENTRHNQDVVMPGFRFHPTEEELIEFYLRRKVEGKHFNIDLITVVDLYRYDPWELPALAAIGEKEWYFYVPRDRKYRNGDRPNRVTTSGYWKATGADRMIRSEDSRSIGLKKTLVFYTGKAPKGKRTSWIMNEYRLPRPDQERIQKSELSLCRVYKKAVSDEDKRRRSQAKEEGKRVKSTENVIEDEIEAIKSSQTMSNSQSLESVCQTHITHNNNESSSSSPPVSPPERMISTTNTLPLQFSSPSSHHLHFSLLNEMNTKLSHGHMERKQYNYGLATAPDRLLENMQESLVMCNNNNSCGWNNNVNVNDQVVELSLASTPHLYGSPLKAQTIPTMAFEAPSHTHGFATELNAFAHHAGNIPAPTRPSPKLWDWSHHGSSC